MDEENIKCVLAYRCMTDGMQGEKGGGGRVGVDQSRFLKKGVYKSQCRVVLTRTDNHPPVIAQSLVKPRASPG